jgi:hypothetical protein
MAGCVREHQNKSLFASFSSEKEDLISLGKTSLTAN